MLTFKVLGSGCAKCKKTVQVIEKVAQELGKTITVEKIEDPASIMAYGVMSTPAVVLNETVVHKGSIPTSELTRKWLE